MKVRGLLWEDFQPLVEMYYALYDEVKENPDVGITLHRERPTLSAEVQWFSDRFRSVLDGSAIVAIAEMGGKAVGICTIERRKEPECQHIGVLGIQVAKAARGTGIGKALLAETIGQAKGKFALVTLSVFASNIRARRLYESFGFRSWGLLPKGILRGERFLDHESMVLDLGGDGERTIDPRERESQHK